MWYIVLTFQKILLPPLSVLIVKTAEYTVTKPHDIMPQKTALFIIFITLLCLLYLVYENVNKGVTEICPIRHSIYHTVECYCKYVCLFSHRNI